MCVCMGVWVYVCVFVRYLLPNRWTYQLQILHGQPLDPVPGAARELKSFVSPVDSCQAHRSVPLKYRPRWMASEVSLVC